MRWKSLLMSTRESRFGLKTALLRMNYQRIMPWGRINGSHAFIWIFSCMKRMCGCAVHIMSIKQHLYEYTDYIILIYRGIIFQYSWRRIQNPVKNLKWSFSRQQFSLKAPCYTLEWVLNTPLIQGMLLAPIYISKIVRPLSIYNPSQNVFD